MCFEKQVLGASANTVVFSNAELELIRRECLPCSYAGLPTADVIPVSTHVPGRYNASLDYFASRVVLF